MTVATVSLRDAYGSMLPELGARFPNVVVLDADLSSSTRTKAFKERFPDRYLNVGIAEQNMVGVAAGIALAGDVPLVNTFAAFLTRRACDQIAISVAYPRLGVKFFGFHAGINLGEDGATQQAVEDLGIMRTIPGIRVFSPIDATDLAVTMNEVLTCQEPTYVRLSRFPTRDLSQTAEPGAADPLAFKILSPGRDLCVITTGTITDEVLKAAAALRTQGLQCQVVAVTRIKPLADSLIDLVAAGGDRPVAVVEEHSVYGGLADALSEGLDRCHVRHRLYRIGIPDRFGESGPPQQLLEQFKLAGEPLIDELRRAIRT